MLVHEPSLVERGLFGETLIETIELVDEDDFLEAMESPDCVILLLGSAEGHEYPNLSGWG